MRLVLRTLLSPGALGLQNTLLRGERRGLYLGLGVVGVLFWLALFGLITFLVGQLWAIDGVGPFLIRKLLEMMIASLFVMLAFSNVVTALSTYYLAEDLDLVLALPVSRTTFHYSRLIDTLGQSSSMMALFGVPVFMAYGYVIDAGVAYFSALALVIGSLLLIQANVGVIIATVLVNVFPARRTRELIVLLGLMMLAGLLILVRTFRPERLLNAEEFDSLAQYMAEVQVPAPALFPPRWATDLLLSTLLHTQTPWLEVGLLITCALATSGIARWTTAWGFDNGWARAQEARSARFYRSSVFDRVAAFTPREWRPLVSKELRVFTRDPAQWSQVFLLIALCAIYLVSVQSLPVDSYSGSLAQRIKEAVSFMNLGMGGFVMAAIAARFQFPAVSREGRAWWIVRSAPIDPVSYLYAKAVPGFVPMLIVGEIVVVGSGLLLGVGGPLLLLEALTALFLCFAISGLAVAFGALWPDFKADNAARAASGPPAVFFMVMALTLVALVMSLEFVAVYVGYRYGPWHPYPLLILTFAATLCVVVGILPMRRAARVLWERGL